MAECTEADKNDQELGSSMLEDQGDKCPTCDSQNVEIHMKNDLLFMYCHDCGGKKLLD